MHKTFIGRLAAGLILLLTATFASHARTVYGPVSASGATSVFVAGGTHGIASRYIGAHLGEAYAEQGADDTLIRLEPGHVRAWDFKDEL